MEDYEQLMVKLVDMLVEHSADLNILNEKEESVVDVCI